MSYVTELQTIYENEDSTGEFLFFDDISADRQIIEKAADVSSFCVLNDTLESPAEILDNYNIIQDTTFVIHFLKFDKEDNTPLSTQVLIDACRQLSINTIARFSATSKILLTDTERRLSYSMNNVRKIWGERLSGVTLRVRAPFIYLPQLCTKN